IGRPEPRRAGQPGAGQGSGVSRDPLLLAHIAVELANEPVLVLDGPVGYMVDEVFDLRSAGVFQSLYAAEVDRVGLDQDRIEFVLADELAEAVAQTVLAINTIAADGLRRPLAMVGFHFGRPGKSPDLLD